MDDTTLAVVLWGLAALVLGWTWVPALIAGLGGTRYANGGTDDPTTVPPAPDETDLAFWSKQLAVLGYAPVGSGWMRITFHGPEWRYETRMRVFHSRAKRAFAFVQKQPKPMDVWWLTMFATCWQDGGIVLTGNAMDEPPEAGDYVVQGIETTDLAAVEELHRSQVERMTAAGRRPDPDGTLDTLLRAMRQHAAPAARYVAAKLGQSYLASHVLIHAFLSVPPAILAGFDHWALPLVNLVLGSLMLGGEQVAKRRAAALSRAYTAARTAH